jgi:RNA polymerase sigma-70 factor (family 1)
MNFKFDYNDRTAFDKIYNTNYRNLFLFAKSLIGDSEEARDIVAESFIKLWTKKKQFINQSHLTAYFYHTIKNASIDYLRKNKLKIKIENQLIQNVAVQENVIQQKFEESELLQQLYEHINQLPKKMQQVFKLTYLEGYSRLQVAHLLNLSDKTIRNHNTAAMKAIRKKLDNLERLNKRQCNVHLTANRHKEALAPCLQGKTFEPDQILRYGAMELLN